MQESASKLGWRGADRTYESRGRISGQMHRGTLAEVRGLDIGNVMPNQASNRRSQLAGAARTSANVHGRELGRLAARNRSLDEQARVQEAPLYSTIQWRWQPVAWPVVPS